MPVPEIRRVTESFPDSSATAAVLLLPETDSDPAALAGYPGLGAALDSIGFTGKKGSFTRVYAPETSSIPLAVAGVGASQDENTVRDAAAVAVRSFTGFETLAIALAPGLSEKAAAEGAALGGYRFEDYRTTAAPIRATTVLLHGDTLTSEELSRAVAIGEAVALTKDLINVPAEWQSPAQLADSAVHAVAGLDLEVTVLDEHDLKEQGFGGVLGVGLGSDRPPRVVRVAYTPPQPARHIALVGKGITFDTGGLSLKPAASMMGMKFDMAGAATSLAVVRAVAKLGLPVQVTAWMCIADNMPSGRATRPGDVLRMLDGTTVEVTNTDAEGRLVLGDGLVAASREKPDVIIDIATLTGAILVALGNRHTGVMGDDDTVAEYLRAAESVDEPAWPLPLPEYMEQSMESTVADLLNANLGDRAGGSLFAGLFLQRFVGRVSDEADAPQIPWVHLDIAGSAEHKGAPYGVTDKGPTGATVRSLIAFVEASAAE